MPQAEQAEGVPDASPRREGDTRYRILFEAAQDAIFVMEGSAFADCNPATEAIFGASRDEIIGRTPIELSPETQPDGRRSREAALEYLEAAYAGRPQRFSWRHQRLDGTLFDAEVSLDRVELAGAPSVLAVVRDVTERERMQAELRRSEAKHRLLAEQASDMISRHDLAGRYTYASPVATEMLGYVPEELHGLDAYDLIHPDDMPAVYASHSGVLDAADVKTVTYRIRKKSGEYLWVETTSRTVRSSASGAPTEIVALTRDISARKAAQDALHASEARLRTLISNFPLIVFSYDEEGVFTLSEGEGLERLGLEPGQVVGLSAFDVYEGQPEICAAIRQVLGGEPYRGNVEVAGVTFDLLMVPVDKGVDRVIGVAADVTEQRANQEARLALERQLMHRQKLETIGVLAGGVAHDFNNALGAIMGNLELALDDLPEGHPSREVVEEARKAGRRAANLTRQMLAYAGRGRMTVERVDVSDLLRGQRAALIGAVPAGIELGVEVPDAGLPLDTDPLQVRQVLSNLVTNAAEACAPGDRVQVRARLRAVGEAELSQSRLAESPAAGVYVSIEVEDTGCGMDAVTAERLTEPFYSTKFPGRGLGLAAVAGIVRAHGGALLVSTQEGSGSRIEALFPAPEGADLAPPNPEEDSVLESTPKKTPQEPPLVLVVDDDDGVRSLLERMLKRIGYRSISAEDAASAVSLFEARASEVRCVVLDKRLPDGDGISTFKRMREIDPGLRVLISSGEGLSASWPELRAQGVHGVLDKPYVLATLRETLEKALE